MSRSPRRSPLPAALCALPLRAAAQEKITIGVSLAQDDNPFYIAMLRGIRARAQELGWDVATVSANEDKLKQINGVQDLVARGVKGILISPIDAVGVNAAYDAAAAAKIPDRVGGARLDLAEPDHPCGHGREADRPRHRGMDGEEARRQGQGRHADRTERRADVQESRRRLCRGDGEASRHPDRVPRATARSRASAASSRPRTRWSPIPTSTAIYTANDDVALGAMQAVMPPTARARPWSPA